MWHVLHSMCNGYTIIISQTESGNGISSTPGVMITQSWLGLLEMSSGIPSISDVMVVPPLSGLQIEPKHSISNTGHPWRQYPTTQLDTQQYFHEDFNTGFTVFYCIIILSILIVFTISWCYYYMKLTNSVFTFWNAVTCMCK